MDNNLPGQAPEGWLATPKPRLAPGMYANRSSRILNSLQIFMICRNIVITLVRFGGPSKQCRQDLIAPPLLKLGLMPFLMFLKSSILLNSCSLVRTSLPRLHLFIRMRTRTLREFPSSRMYAWEPTAAFCSGSRLLTIPVW
jgi:hypothetical protein